VSRRFPLFIRLSAIALMATGFLLRADDPPASAPTPPPGYKVVYHGSTPIFVKDQLDPLRHAGNIGDDPLDPQKVFSETNPASNKTFNPGTIDGANKSADLGSQKTFATKVYDTGPSNVYNLGSKSTYKTASFDGTKAAPGFGQAFATKDAPTDLDHADSAFAPIGASEQNRTAPIDAKTYATFAAPDSNKDFSGPEADALHRHAKPGERIDGDMQVIGEIPDRPLSVDEVRALINHGFKPNLDQPPAPASKPLNDPNYQPEPMRIEPTSPDDAPPVAPATGTHKVDDDDTNDPVPSPGTMAEHPEDTQPLPSK
jgi:hypothetical protein